MYAVPIKARIERWVPWNWSDRWFRATQVAYKSAKCSESLSRFSSPSNKHFQALKQEWKTMNSMDRVSISLS